MKPCGISLLFLPAFPHWVWWINLGPPDPLPLPPIWGCFTCNDSSVLCVFRFTIVSHQSKVQFKPPPPLSSLECQRHLCSEKPLHLALYFSIVFLQQDCPWLSLRSPGLTAISETLNMFFSGLVLKNKGWFVYFFLGFPCPLSYIGKNTWYIWIYCLSFLLGFLWVHNLHLSLLPIFCLFSCLV